MELIIRNARLRKKKKLFDIGIEKGLIKKISNKISGKAKNEIEAQGRLTTPAFIEPHLHLDKALTSDMVNANKISTLNKAIELMWDVKKSFTKKDVKKRAGRVIELAALNGTTRMRTHCDIDTVAGLTGLRALLELKRECRDIMDLEIIAFPQEGIFTNPGTEDLMRKAMESGADVVGGMPHIELTDETAKSHVDVVFEIAKEFDADIDSHVDETDDPLSRTIEYLTWKTIEEGYQGRVTACHVCSLSAYDDYHAQKVIQAIKRANINVQTNPETNVFLQGRLDGYPKRRGLTRVKQLVQAGVNVTFGQDCIKDPFYPFGKVDPLQTGFILSLLAQMTTPDELEKIYDMMTFNAAKAMNITDQYGIEIGKRADIVIIDCESITDAFRNQPVRKHVIKEGRIIAVGKIEKKLHRSIT
jgi:cytosine deaminase